MREGLRRNPEMVRDPEDLGHDLIGCLAYERRARVQQLLADRLDERQRRKR